MRTRFLILGFLFISFGQALGQITKPSDAPKPLTPTESLKQVKLPQGFRLELVVAEPLIRQPSGVCWDAEGNLFVSELHGYNREGQYDIEDLNKTGKLDRVVRRISANKNATRRAELEQIGTVKKMIDENNDGKIDRISLWADNLPACFGICPARDGIIAVCSPDIIYLADRDNDGKAEIREKLFTGFKVGIIERRMNSPQWGPDNWIYIDGGQGGLITGPNLSNSITLPATAFRIKADGSAIEAVSGHTSTYGFTFNQDGDRFVISTGTPGIQVAPLPWRYLTRNPDIAVRASRRNAANYNTTFPTSEPHPWRTKRAADPGFGKYYRDRYGSAESIPNGYFTSACSPLIYKDNALPGLNGQILACAPAQNFVHRAEVKRDGVLLNIQRLKNKTKTEFLTSDDIWFHPIHLSIGPEGAIYIADFYREIIEDYSAIPRYLQQQYGLDDGRDHGRLWRLTHDNIAKTESPNLASLSLTQLSQEIFSPRFWRRQTARRLLVERNAKQTERLPSLTKLTLQSKSTSETINALYALEGVNQLSLEILTYSLSHSNPGVRRHGLRLAEKNLDKFQPDYSAILKLINDPSPLVRLQLALTLGEIDDIKSINALAELAKQHLGETWLDGAILSSLGNRPIPMLKALLKSESKKASKAQALIPKLCAAIGSRKNSKEISDLINIVSQLNNYRLQVECLKGLRKQFKSAEQLTIRDSEKDFLTLMATTGKIEIRETAIDLIRLLKLESFNDRQKRLDKAINQLSNVQNSTQQRLAAVNSLTNEKDISIALGLLAAYPTATPPVRSAILKTVFSRKEYFPSIIDAMENKQLPAAAMNAVQRTSLLQTESSLAKRANDIFERIQPKKETVEPFIKALSAKRDISAGHNSFIKNCATCHKAHGTGFTLGPDLTSEFRRAEETIVQDILAPSSKIAGGYETYVIETKDGRVLSGVLASESGSSLALNLPEGQQLDVLRKDIKTIKSLDVSLMPESLGISLKPKEIANIIAWLQQPPTRKVLFEDNPKILDWLSQGDGKATMDTIEKISGLASLKITPPQRYSSTIPNWSFKIREEPDLGEFRYLRLAWKAPNANGVMIELANDGKWPEPNNAKGRYFSGKNTSKWQAKQLKKLPPKEWTIVIRDLWKDFGNLTLTGIAPTALGGPVWFDQIELYRTKPNK